MAFSLERKSAIFHVQNVIKSIHSVLLLYYNKLETG